MTDITPDEIRRIEARWKSDVDLKLDAIISFNDTYRPLLTLLLEREIARKKLRDAVIEKSLTGLIIAAVVALVTLAWNGALSEFKAIAQGFRK